MMSMYAYLVHMSRPKSLYSLLLGGLVLAVVLGIQGLVYVSQIGHVRTSCSEDPQLGFTRWSMTFAVAQLSYVRFLPCPLTPSMR